MRHLVKNYELKSYECSLDGEHWEMINALSAGMAKSKYISDCDFARYIDVRCRTTGYPYTSEDFVRNAKYRRIEFAYCGMKVKVGDWYGVITGHNSSANLNVLAIDGPYKNQILNCHPHSEITYYNKKGEIIKTYKK